jgi:hypothetical protein
VRQQENLPRKNSPRDGSVSPTFQITELLRERYPFLAGSASLKITCRGPASRTFHGRSADGIDRLRSRLAPIRSGRAINCGSEKSQAGFVRGGRQPLKIDEQLCREQFEVWIERADQSQPAGFLRCRANDVTAVYMMGGTSFLPTIRKLFEGILGTVSIRVGEEFAWVAEGLALYALELV